MRLALEAWWSDRHPGQKHVALANFISQTFDETSPSIDAAMSQSFTALLPAGVPVDFMESDPYHSLNASVPAKSKPDDQHSVPSARPNPDFFTGTVMFAAYCNGLAIAYFLTRMSTQAEK